jgi:hypothetical protein
MLMYILSLSDPFGLVHSDMCAVTLKQHYKGGLCFVIKLQNKGGLYLLVK